MTLFLLLSLFGSPVFAEQKTPQILAVHGAVWVQNARDDKKFPAKAGVVLREKAVLETGPSSSLKIRLKSGTEITMLDSTHVVLPGISWDDGDVPIFILEKGKVHWTADVASKTTLLKTPLYELTPPKGDFVFRFDPSTVQGEVQVVQGVIVFGAINAETSVTLKERQKSTFQGALEEGEIAYDLLLKGRKIPRGTLGPAAPMNDEDLKPFFEEERRIQEDAKRRAKQALEQKKAESREGVICKNPRGRFNECAWVCEGTKKGSKNCGGPNAHCIRQRCNANGEWADRQVLPEDEGRQLCKLKPVLKACDY